MNVFHMKEVNCICTRLVGVYDYFILFFVVILKN